MVLRQISLPPSRLLSLNKHPTVTSLTREQREGERDGEERDGERWRGREMEGERDGERWRRGREMEGKKAVRTESIV